LRCFLQSARERFQAFHQFLLILQLSPMVFAAVAELVTDAACGLCMKQMVLFFTMICCPHRVGRHLYDTKLRPGVTTEKGVLIRGYSNVGRGYSNNPCIRREQVNAKRSKVTPYHSSSVAQSTAKSIRLSTNLHRVLVDGDTREGS